MPNSCQWFQQDRWQQGAFIYIPKDESNEFGWHGFLLVIFYQHIKHEKQNGYRAYHNNQCYSVGAC